MKKILSRLCNVKLKKLENDDKNYDVHFNLRGKMKKPKSITLEDLAEMVVTGFSNVNNRLDKIETRLDNVEKRLDNVEKRLDNVEKDIALIKNCPTIQKELCKQNNL